MYFFFSLLRGKSAKNLSSTAFLMAEGSYAAKVYSHL